MAIRSGFRPTHLAVASTAAAVLMAGGVSFAAIKLPADSVGSRELKNNAVTSREVKNKSLKAADFADGQLPEGPRGPTGATGAPGAKGDTGGPCDGLLCPGTDLDSGAASIVVAGLVSRSIAAYRLSCGVTVCTVAVGGADTSNRELDDWFQLARTNPVDATRDFELTIYNESVEPIGRYAVSEGLPTEMSRQNGRFQLKITATSVARVAP